MMKQFNIEFTETIPEDIQSGVLYMSLKYNTAIHKCPCGCGNEVVTPLSPTDWKMNYDGESVSLRPSIGNWNLPCQSHYWITDSRVEWAPKWSRERIEYGRKEEKQNKEKYYEKKKSQAPLWSFFRK